MVIKETKRVNRKKRENDSIMYTSIFFHQLSISTDDVPAIKMFLKETAKGMPTYII